VVSAQPDALSLRHLCVAMSGRRSGEPPGVSVAAALSWAVSHADCRLTPSILGAFTSAVYELATHTLPSSTARESDSKGGRTRAT